MTERQPVVAIGLLTEDEFRRFGRDLQEVFVVPKDGEFDDVLRRLNEARDSG